MVDLLELQEPQLGLLLLETQKHRLLKYAHAPRDINDRPTRRRHEASSRNRARDQNIKESLRKCGMSEMPNHTITLARE